MTTAQEFINLKRKVKRVLDKCEKTGYGLSDLDIGAISSIGRAEKMEDVNFMALQHFERLYQTLIK